MFGMSDVKIKPLKGLKLINLINSVSQIMESNDEDLQQSVEYVDAICLEKGIILPDGCTTATLTTVDEEGLPLTFIVSQPLLENSNGNESIESLDAVDCDVIQENSLGLGDKDDEHTVYTVHFPSDSKSEEADFLETSLEKSNPVTEDAIEQEDIMKDQSRTGSYNSHTRLEDFMDVVTTYKCKFCRFSCPWKSGLMSHLRCCHINEKNSLGSNKTEKEDKKANFEQSSHQASTSATDLNSSSEIEKVENSYVHSSFTETSLKTETEDLTSNVSSVELEQDFLESPDSPAERHIFLCGQCSDGFVSLEECKQHMVQDHQLNLDQEQEFLPDFEEDVIKPPPKRGRGKAKTKKEKSIVPKKRVRKETVFKEPKNRNRIFKNLVDEFDSSVKRKLRTGFVNDKAFRCTRTGCGHRFTTESNLHYHYSSHQAIGKPFMCPECREEFKYWRQVATHLWREHTIDIDLHSCPDCDYKSHSFFKLDNHRKIHSDERAYVCETCGKGFKQISQLRNHVVIHMDRKNLPEKRWYSEQECDICGRKFSDTKCLRKHHQAVHNKLKPYICNYCGHLSARKAMLELHMRQHTGEKPFICEHCDYRTGDHNSLRRHRMRHTGDKPYKCPHCPYACIQAISYKTHLRNKHPGMEGLFSCTLCSFKSVSKENFENHMADHKREQGDGLVEVTDAVVAQEPTEIIMDGDAASSAVHMQLSENAIQQLEGFLPSNITAAQLICSCLNAMNKEGGTVNLPPGVTTTATADGSQTITIQVPCGQDADGEPFYFTLLQQDGSTALVVPTDNQTIQDDIEGVQLTEHDITSAAASLECPSLPEDSSVTEHAELVIANMESLSDSGGFNAIMQGS